MDQKLIGRLYRDVPDDQRREFLDFVASHPPRRARVAAAPFEYLACGSGPRALLLLPGLLGEGNSLYQQVIEFEPDHRVCVLTYPDTAHLPTQLDAISTVLAAEGIERVVAVGQTLGGYLAQAYAWAHPQRVEGLVLVHAGLPDPRLGAQVRLRTRGLGLLPAFLLRRYLRGVLLRMLAALEASSQLDAAQARLVAAHLRYRFARLLTRRRILARYYLMARLHEQQRQEPGAIDQLSVLVLYAQGNVFTRDLGRLREVYPRAQEIQLGRGHNLSLLVKPRESNRAIREFLASL
jgi:pimeloyl-ACP methyl ester carboxylesterase